MPIILLSIFLIKFYFKVNISSNIIRVVDLASSLFVPQTIDSVLVRGIVNIADWVMEASGSLSQFFSGIAIATEAEYLAIAKAKSRDIWKTIVAQRTPGARSFSL